MLGDSSLAGEVFIATKFTGQIATAATIGAVAGASLRVRRGARSSVAAALAGAAILGGLVGKAGARDAHPEIDATSSARSTSRPSRSPARSA